MAKITKMLVGESLVGDGNEVAHIDLIIGPRILNIKENNFRLKRKPINFAMPKKV